LALFEHKKHFIDSIRGAHTIAGELKWEQGAKPPEPPHFNHWLLLREGRERKEWRVGRGGKGMGGREWRGGKEDPRAFSQLHICHYTTGRTAPSSSC